MVKDTGIPLMASFDLTYRCNLKCRMCNAWKIKRNENELDLGEWKKVVEGLIKAFSVRTFRLVGGEPFMHSNLKEIVHHIKARDCSLTMVTNGTLIDRKMAHFLVSECVDSVRISVDGLQETDDFYRGKGSFVRTMEGLQAILQEKKLHSAVFPRIEIHPFVSKLNIRDMDKLLYLAKQLGVDFNFHYLTGSIAGREPRSRDPGFPGAANHVSLLSAQEKRDFENRFSMRQSVQEHFLQEFFSRIRQMPICVDCPRTAYHFLIDPWGYVFPCEHLYNCKYGNCRDETVEEIWRSETRSILRNKIKRGDLRICLLCGHRKLSPPAFVSNSHVFSLNLFRILQPVLGKS